MTGKIMRAMDNLFSSVLRGFESLETGVDEMRAIAEPTWDPRLVTETFLDPSDLGFGAQLCSGTGKPRRWCREEIICRYNSKMAELLSAWLEKFSPSPSSEVILKVACGRISSYVKIVLAGGDDITEKDGMFVCLFVCLFVCFALFASEVMI